MKSLGRRLKTLREDAKMSQEELGKIIGISRSAIGMYENDQREPGLEKLNALADYFNVDLNYLNGKSDNTTRILSDGSYNPRIRINILGRVPAGVPIEAIDDIVDWEDLDPRIFSSDHEYFGLIVRGDSMYPKYMEGDTIICQRADDAESGRDVVAYVNGHEATVKQLIKHENGSLELRPINTAYPPRIYTPYQANNEPVKILGFVREIRRKV